MISMTLKRQNWEEPLSGNEMYGINPFIVKKNWFHIGFTWKINPLKPSYRLKNF